MIPAMSFGMPRGSVPLSLLLPILLAAVPCTGIGQPMPELCNGVDDDGDGEVDEDFLPGAECRARGLRGGALTRKEGCKPGAGDVGSGRPHSLTKPPLGNATLVAWRGVRSGVARRRAIQMQGSTEGAR
jgi:hypothetical protein